MMNYNKRRADSFGGGPDPYKRPRPFMLQEDMHSGGPAPGGGGGYQQGYVGDQMSYPPGRGHIPGAPPPPDPYFNNPAYNNPAYPAGRYPAPGGYDPPPQPSGGYSGYPNPNTPGGYGAPPPPPADHGYHGAPPPPHFDFSSNRGRGGNREGGSRGGRGGEGGGGRGRGRGDYRGGDYRGGGHRGRGGPPRGRGGWAPKKPVAAVPADEIEEEEFNCSRMGPIKALIQLYPDAEFEQTLLVQNELGHAHGFQVKIEDKNFYGEGSSMKIAKGLAALDALTYIKAPGCEDLANVCDVYTEMKKMEAIKELQEQKSEEKKKNPPTSKYRRGPGAKKFTRQAVPRVPGEVKSNVPPNPPVLVNFNLLRQKYVGQNNEGGLMQTFNPVTEKDRTCVLIIQGHVFKGHGPTDKVARDKAAGEAIVFFEKTPPEFVQKMKVKASREPVYDRDDPDDYVNMLYCKAWKFAVELTKDLNPVYTRKQNLAFVLKVYGSDQDIDNVEVVAMASGAKVIAMEYMSSDGYAINDCGGESLCIRAFRKYLLNQLAQLSGGQNSIFRRNPFGRIMMKEGFKFVFLTNCSPMGDCKQFDAQFYNALRNKELCNVKHDDFEATTSLVSRTDKKTPTTKISFDPVDCGKLHVYRKMALDHVPDQCVVPKPDNMIYLSPIPAPSAKLALRNVVGVQGALLSTLIDSVYFPEYYVGRAFDEDAMARALAGRLKGATLPAGVSVRVPEVHRLTWKPSRMADKTTIYAFVWCEGSNIDLLRGDIGKIVDTIKPGDISAISDEMLKAYDSREIKSASPSQFCSYNFYEDFAALLSSLNKTADTCTNLKKSATAYQTAKQAVYKAFEKNGLGSWPKKTTRHNF